MSAPEISAAMELIHVGQYSEAFHLVSTVANNPHASSEDRADAYHMMGSVARLLPELGDGDECGFSYLMRAVELQPDHLWALYGIVQTYGDHPVIEHHDTIAFASAIERLIPRLNELDQLSQETVRSKYEQLKSRQAKPPSDNE